MPKKSREELRRLHFINALFSRATGNDLFLAQQIKEGICFSLAEFEQQTREHPDFAKRYDAAFNAAAAQLLEKFFDSEADHGFFHWDAARTLTSATPLFARAELMEGIRRLTKFTESTLLVTNLRAAFLPSGKRATSRRQRDYQAALDYVRDLTAARLSPRAKLNLLFL